MEIVRHEIPFESEGYLGLLCRIFGAEEEELERLQVSGRENPWNTDIAFTAEENGVVYGTSHVTFSKLQPDICGFSGLSADPAVRGRGIGKQLFGAMVEEAEGSGVTAAFLGTNNRMAAEMYAGFGFSYLPGTYCMAKFYGSSRYRFFQRYEVRPESIQIKPMDPSLRIAVIPLLMNEGPGFLLDSNAKVFNNRCITQVSTMGLYPKFLKIAEEGGQVFMALENNGLCGGIASVLEDRADFFVCKGFEAAAERLVETLTLTQPEAVFRIAAEDIEKQSILENLGYRKTGEELLLAEGFTVNCGLWKNA